MIVYAVLADVVMLQTSSATSEAVVQANCQIAPEQHGTATGHGGNNSGISTPALQAFTSETSSCSSCCHPALPATQTRPFSCRTCPSAS